MNKPRDTMMNIPDRVSLYPIPRRKQPAMRKIPALDAAWSFFKEKCLTDERLPLIIDVVEEAPFSSVFIAVPVSLHSMVTLEPLPLAESVALGPSKLIETILF